MDSDTVSVACTHDLDCRAVVHTVRCPWAPHNAEVFRLSAREYDALVARLDQPAREMPRLTRMLDEHRCSGGQCVTVWDTQTGEVQESWASPDCGCRQAVKEDTVQ